MASNSKEQIDNLLIDSAHDKVKKAVDRLIEGRPQARELAKRPILRISVQSVSIEARISRTTIYKSQELLQYIRSASEQSNKIRTKKRTRNEETLRLALDEQRKLNIDLLSENATLLHRLQMASGTPLKVVT